LSWTSAVHPERLSPVVQANRSSRPVAAAHRGRQRRRVMPPGIDALGEHHAAFEADRHQRAPMPASRRGSRTGPMAPLRKAFPYGGTDGSNPSPSSGESGANLTPSPWQLRHRHGLRPHQGATGYRRGPNLLGPAYHDRRGPHRRDVRRGCQLLDPRGLGFAHRTALRCIRLTCRYERHFAGDCEFESPSLRQRVEQTSFRTTGLATSDSATERARG
jgi:hypothetical protein